MADCVATVLHSMAIIYVVHQCAVFIVSCIGGIIWRVALKLFKSVFKVSIMTRRHLKRYRVSWFPTFRCFSWLMSSEASDSKV